MTEMEIVQKAISEKRQVLAVILSKWHLAGVLSFIFNLRKRGTYTGAIIAVLPHPTSGYIVDEGTLPELNVTIIHCAPDGLLKEWRVLLTGWLKYCLHQFLAPVSQTPSSVIHFLCVMQPVVRNLLPLLAQNTPMDRIQITLIDEGIGTYLPSSHWKHVNTIELQNQNVLKRCLATFSKYIVLLPFSSPKEMFLFKRINGKLRLNKEVVEKYRDFFNDAYLRIYEKGDARIVMMDGFQSLPICLYLSQPNVEQGLMTEDAFREILWNLSSLCRKHNYELLVKPHPREMLSRYEEVGISVMRTSHIAEAIVSELKPVCVLGITSSALVTIPCLFNIPSISIINIIKDKLDQNDASKIAFRCFVELFSDIIAFPSDTDGLNNALKAIGGYSPPKRS